MAKYEVPALSYAFNALEPYIDARTMEIHHDKHHAAYVTNLNAALDKHPELFEKPLEELVAKLENVPEDIREAVRNHGGGHLNHSFFWKAMAPAGGPSPSGIFLEALNAKFGSFAVFQKEFEGSAAKRFGSGWGWLSVDAAGALVVHSTPNQDSPLAEGKIPVLGVDVWEHAYYLNYQNRRPDYLAAFWNVVNWKQAEDNYAEAMKMAMK
jgi:Fe-Mn family superoxide dismutase